MHIRNMVLCALFAALLALCAWLALPLGQVAFTLQTFGVFLTLGVLGGKWGTAAIGIYLLLGAVGLPVFTGFQGGAGALLGATGGYLTGFLLSGLLYWLITGLFGSRKGIQLTAMVLGLMLCYLFGSLWYWGVFLPEGSPMGLGAVLAQCVLPYVLPDGIKLALAFTLSRRLKRR